MDLWHTCFGVSPCTAYIDQPCICIFCILNKSLIGDGSSQMDLLRAAGWVLGAKHMLLNLHGP